MFTLGPIGFAAPWLLLALIALPILWLLLRAVPPAPIRRRFPGVALLLGLKDEEAETDKTPWWLLLLRTLAVGAVIIGFAGPILNPDDRAPGTGPLLIAVDGGWADARDWPQRVAKIEAPAELVGGDVLKFGNTVWVGLSERTNDAGAAKLEAFFAPIGARVVRVPVEHAPSLKAAVKVAARRYYPDLTAVSVDLGASWRRGEGRAYVVTPRGPADLRFYPVTPKITAAMAYPEGLL